MLYYRPCYIVKQIFQTEYRRHPSEDILPSNIPHFTRYPAQTMKKISALGVNLGKEYKEMQKTRLQRTFVKASEAAEAKVMRGDDSPCFFVFPCKWLE